MNKHERYAITCVGACTLDDYNQGETILPGGGGLNAAVHFKRLLPTAEISVLGAIGNDMNTNIILKTLKERQINAQQLHRLQGNTSRQHIGITPMGEKIFSRYDAGVIMQVQPTEEDIAYLNQQDLILGVLFTQIEPHLRAILLQQQSKGSMCVDFMNLSDYADKADIVRNLADHLDIGFFGLKPTQTSLIDELKNIAAEKQKLFVITLGEQGSIGVNNTQIYRQAAIAVPQVIDTTGAGDSFAAAFLVKYLQTRDVAASLLAGSHNAADVIQKRGAF